ncbi:MAG TPA: glycosyltransferase family 39 protein [Tepidisphaeraceae bacterium]|nr:glycosyltransferase family 39 protein [Tepidisphaeraceae bacterium]
MLSLTHLEAPAPVVRQRVRAQRSAPSALRRYWQLLVLLLITAIGAIIRFTHLAHPTLWNDEALVYWRTCGTYQQLLDVLRNDGFGPLHYELHWLIAQHFKPTPEVLRSVPAICGTLMIPAIYFLARQMLPKSTSLVAAAFTACSAFLIFYSRDAKMYMDTWLFAVLSVGALLWWLRSRRATAWLCWVAAGCTAVGIHASSMPVIALSPLFLLTHRSLRWRQGLLMIAGLAVIFAGPLVYYTKFNRFIDNVEEDGWSRTGIQWVGIVNEGMTGPQLVRNGATALGMGWAWPKDAAQELSSKPRWGWPRTNLVGPIAPAMLKWPKLAAELLISVLIAAVLPWPRRERPRDHLHPLERGWRVLLWLSLWILLPGYIFYCHSVPRFTSPLTWPMEVLPRTTGWLTDHSRFIEVLVAILLIAGAIWRPTRSALQKTIVIAVMFGVLYAIYSVCHEQALKAAAEGRPWRSIWMPRYFGFLWPALGIATAALLMRLPTIYIRVAAVALLLGVNLAFGAARVFAWTEPPVDQMAKDVYDAQPRNSATRTYTDVPRGDPNPGGGSIESIPGRYYLQLYAWHQPMSPYRFRIQSIGEYVIRGGYRPMTIADEVRKNPQLKRVIVWEDNPFEAPHDADELGPMLPGWRLASDTWYPVRTYWEWQERWNFRRVEYVR